MEVILSDKNGDRVQPVIAIAWYGGLCVTPTWWAYDYDLNQYSVTHIESGALIWGGITDREAIRLMAALCDRIEIDWTAPFKAFYGNQLLERRVRQIIREVVGE